MSTKKTPVIVYNMRCHNLNGRDLGDYILCRGRHGLYWHRTVTGTASGKVIPEVQPHIPMIKHTPVFMTNEQAKTLKSQIINRNVMALPTMTS